MTEIANLSLVLPSYLVESPELNMRISGFILQILFVVIVLIDLYNLSREEEFDIPKVKYRIKKWYTDLKEIFKKSATFSGSLTDKISIGENLKVHTDFNLYEDDVEKNLRLLAREIKSLKKRTDKKFHDIDTTLKVLESQILDEVEKREEEIESFKGFYKSSFYTLKKNEFNVDYRKKRRAVLSVFLHYKKAWFD